MSWVADHDVDDEEEDVGNINELFVCTHRWGRSIGEMPRAPSAASRLPILCRLAFDFKFVVLVKGGTVHMNPLFCSNSISLIYQL